MKFSEVIQNPASPHQNGMRGCGLKRHGTRQRGLGGRFRPPRDSRLTAARWLLALLTACPAFTAGTALAEEAPLVRAGVARIDVTPDEPVMLNGYGNRTEEYENVSGPLWAKALALGTDRDGPAVLVTVDNCAVPASVVEQVASRLHAHAGVARSRFVVCSSHTHSAPCLTGAIPYIFGSDISRDRQVRIDRYTARLTDALEKVSLEAIADQRRRRVAWTVGTVRFAINRRVIRAGQVNFGSNDGGPVDHTLPMLAVSDADGTLRAVLVTYACHATTMGGDFNQVGGDWVGYAQEAIERNHPGVVAMVSIGCGADSRPEPARQLDFAQRHGLEVAEEVERLLAGALRPVSDTLSTRFRQIGLPLAALPDRAEWVARARESSREAYRARKMLERIDRGETLPTTVSYPVQTWTFGDGLAMVFLGGEVVVDYALHLRQVADADRLWIHAYSNDVPCYIASKRVLAEGGYEADTSMAYYGQPTRFAPEVEQRIIETVEELLPAELLRDGNARDSRRDTSRGKP